MSKICEVHSFQGLTDHEECPWCEIEALKHDNGQLMRAANAEANRAEELVEKLTQKQYELDGAFDLIKYYREKYEPEETERG